LPIFGFPRPSARPEIAMQRRFLVAATTVAFALFAAGCSTTNPEVASGDAVAKRRSLDADVDGALTKLYSQIPNSADVVRKAKGVLVFPRVVSAGLVVGGSYGQGALRVGNRTEGYYSTTALSAGLLAGADSKAIYILFLTEDALNKFRDSKGWSVGADASVSVLKAGADIGIDTQTAQQPVVGYVLTNAGLMANLSIDGTKVNRLQL
jgi:lipid-binding SYLF domain-containing protein